MHVKKNDASHIAKPNTIVYGSYRYCKVVTAWRLIQRVLPISPFFSKIASYCFRLNLFPYYFHPKRDQERHKNFYDFDEPSGIHRRLGGQRRPGEPFQCPSITASVSHSHSVSHRGINSHRGPTAGPATSAESGDHPGLVFRRV